MLFSNPAISGKIHRKTDEAEKSMISIDSYPYRRQKAIHLRCSESFMLGNLKETFCYIDRSSMQMINK